jgi:hypothetical protein
MVVVLGFLAGFLFLNRGHLIKHYTVNPRGFLLVALLTATVLCLLGRANQVHFGSLGMKGSWGDWFRLVTVSAFTNYVPPSAGFAVKAFYLKRVHGTPFRTFIVGQGTLFIIILATNGAVGLGVLALTSPTHLWGAVGAGFAVMFSSGALLFVPEPVALRLAGRWLGQSFSAGRTTPGSIVEVAFVQVGILLAAAGTLKVAFNMGPEQVPMAVCVALAAAYPLSRIVAITPGALGIRELLVGGIAYLLGFAARDAVIASTFSRFVEFFVVCTLGSLFTAGFSGRIISTYDSGDTDD